MKNFLLYSVFAVLSSGFVNKLSGQIITTVAGNDSVGYFGDGGPSTLSKLNGPMGVALDNTGNLYFADDDNQRIRKVDLSGIITTIAGNGINGYSGDGGQATDAEFSYPQEITVDGFGNIYITEHNNELIRKVSPSGIISTYAGSRMPTTDSTIATAVNLAFPEGIAVDRSGNLYIVESGYHRIRKVMPSGSISTIAGNYMPVSSGDGGPASAAYVKSPTSIAVDSLGNIYFGEESRIRKINTSGIISTIAGNGRIVSRGDGGPATDASIGVCYGITLDEAGNLFFSDNAYNVIRKIDASGTITTVAGNGYAGYAGDGGPAIAAEFFLPWGIAIDRRGLNLYIGDLDNNKVRKVSWLTANVPVLSCQSDEVVFKLYPNPACQQFTLLLSSPTPQEAQITITNLTGQVVKTLQATTNNAVDISLEQPPGVYFISAATESGRWVEKVEIE